MCASGLDWFEKADLLIGREQQRLPEQRNASQVTTLNAKEPLTGRNSIQMSWNC